jgi:hypothetical protein
MSAMMPAHMTMARSLRMSDAAFATVHPTRAWVNGLIRAPHPEQASATPYGTGSSSPPQQVV